MGKRKYSFAPLETVESRVLILGSLPGELSLQQQQYYAHPRNAFWHILCDSLQEPWVDDYAVRCLMLQKHQIALWDVVQCAERVGSLDTAIKHHQPNDLKGFMVTHPKLELILLNGGKAATLFARHVGDIETSVIALPSTSPAYAAMSYEEKKRRWSQALKIVTM